jgi:predicted extracellular nuclease
MLAIARGLLSRPLQQRGQPEASGRPLPLQWRERVRGGQPLQLKSKGGDQGLFGPSQPPTLISEIQRRQQATIVRGFVDQVLAEDPRANVVVLGDLNDFHFSSPLAILRGDPTPGAPVLTDLVSLLPPEDRYTFIFDGNSQALDNILVSPRLARGAKVDIVHVNSEFLVQTSDHDPIVARLVVTPVRDD